MLTLEQAEHVRHKIGNPVFALETNLAYLKTKITDKDQKFILGVVFASMEHSIEQIKQVLADLKEEKKCSSEEKNS